MHWFRRLFLLLVRGQWESDSQRSLELKRPEKPARGHLGGDCTCPLYRPGAGGVEEPIDR